MRRLIALCFTIVALAACDDTIGPTSPSSAGPSFAISDGAHLGNPDFFWNPPLAPDASNSDNWDADGFNPNILVNVDVCRLDKDPVLFPPSHATPAACVAGAPFVHFGPSDITVSGEQYHVNWQTGGVDASAFYRIHAYVGEAPPVGETLGFIDLDPVSGGMKNVRTGDVVAFQDGRTLPIKFRVERGALCDNDVRCVETTVTNDNPVGDHQILKLLDGPNGAIAGALIPDGWLPPGGPQSVVFVIEWVDTGINDRATGTQENPCHATLELQQFNGCFRFRTIPELEEFERGRQFTTPITVATCFVLHDTGDPREPFAQLWASDEGEAPRPLPSADDALVLTNHDCEGAFAAGRGSNPLMRLASAGWSKLTGGLGWAFGVKPAYAVDLGLGGLAEALSNIGPAVTAQLEPAEDLSRTVDPGGTTLIAARVVGTTHHHDEPELTEGIPAVQVTYTVDPGHGFLFDAFEEESSPLALRTVVTNVDPDNSDDPFDGGGFAPVVWEVPETPGTYTMRAIVSATGAPRTYTVVVPEPPPPSGIDLAPTERRMLSMQTGAQLQVRVTEPFAVAVWQSSDLEKLTVSASGLVTAVLGGESIEGGADAQIVTVLANGNPGPSLLANSFSFDLFPRITTLAWRPVEGAATYEVITEFGNGADSPFCSVPAECGVWTRHSLGSTTTTGLQHTFEFVGAQPGRWQVTARNAAGAIISVSAFVYFDYDI